MKILAFAASNSSTSINRQLVLYAAGRLQELSDQQVIITTADLNDYEMPIYSSDREKASGVPDLAQKFRQLIGEADAVLVSFAEHNGNVSAAWKNIFDWMSRLDGKVWQGKPAVFLAASPGGRGGATVLASQTAMAPHHGADLRGQAGIAGWYTAWDAATGSLTRPEDSKAIDAAVQGLL